MSSYSRSPMLTIKMYSLLALILSMTIENTYLQALQSEDSAKIVRSFNNYLKSYFASYEKDRRQRVAKLDRGWVSEYFEPLPDTLQIDVQRADSLVSPYKGTAEFRMRRRFTKFHSSKSDAEQDTNFIQTDSLTHRHTYFLQDDVWVPKLRRHLVPELERWFDCDEVIAEGPQKGATDLYGCREKKNPY